MWRPGWSQSACRIGARAGVVVTTSWLSATRRAGSGSGRASMPRRRGEVGGGGGGLRRVAAPDEGAGEGADEVGGLELQAGLDAGAEDAGGLDRGRGHVAGGDGAGGGGADVGQVAVVEEERLDEAGGGGEEDHQAVEARAGRASGCRRSRG